MKTQLIKPARSRVRYTDQYKQEALELWRASGRSAATVAAELVIRAPLLYRRSRLEREPGAAKIEPQSKRSVLSRDGVKSRFPDRWIRRQALGATRHRAARPAAFYHSAGSRRPPRRHCPR